MDYQKFVDDCNKRSANTLMETLQIRYTSAAEGELVATMPVTPQHHQPMGLLHGGASAAIAESVGSAASQMFISSAKEEIRGIELSCNHLRSKTDGMVTATAKIVHKGRTLHLWEIKITDEENRLVSLCRLTNIVLERKI